MELHLLQITVFLLAVHSIIGSHFRGGTINWRYIGNRFIKVKYRVGFKFSHVEPGFESCTAEAQKARTELSTRGDLECEGCDDLSKMREFKWICDDYDEEEDSSIGHFTYYYEISKENPKFTISYKDCCWIGLESPRDTAGGASGWKLFTHIDISPRPDDGTVNASPVAANIPLEKFYKGCNYRIRIPVTDPDNDALRCRYAKKDAGECPDEGYSRACGPPTSGLTIDKKTCTLEFDTTYVSEGYHAVNVVIEDYVRPVKRKSTPLSQVSLLFLLYVEKESTSCMKPEIIDTPSCLSIQPNTTFKMVVRADPGDPLKPISKIKTVKPYGMRASRMVDDPDVPGRKMVTLTWVPAFMDLGEHTLCYSALDSDSYTSGLVCTFIHVEKEPLRPVVEESYPPEHQQVYAGETWIVRFNKKVMQPRSSAFIKVINPFNDKVVYEIDATDPAVTFVDNEMHFLPPRDDLIMGATSMKIQYELILDEGVALPKTGGCVSEPAQWIVGVNEGFAPGELGAPGTGIATRPLKCSLATTEIFVPDETVRNAANCFLQLPDETVDVTGEVTSTPYTVCCPGSCQGKAQPGPPGPPGTKK